MTFINIVCAIHNIISITFSCHSNSIVTVWGIANVNVCSCIRLCSILSVVSRMIPYCSSIIIDHCRGIIYIIRYNSRIWLSCNGYKVISLSCSYWHVSSYCWFCSRIDMIIRMSSLNWGCRYNSCTKCKH